MPPKKEKKVQVKGDEAEKTILEYLEQQYRPYSVNDIIQNLHGNISKAAAVKALENLTAENKIVTKVLGKMSISVANKVEVDQSEESINYDEELEVMKQNIKEASQNLSALQTELSETTKYPSDEELDAELKSLQKEVEDLSHKIEAAKSKPSISTESVNKIKSLSASITSESQKRQKLYKNFLKYIAEFIDPKKLIFDLGLEEVTMVQNKA
ncbi:hypothetical protein WICANDRAFT_67454 [Wickerhamomyces anomalus NRRL Y-366-8]|uniref:Homologous-pairing protein 2 winged helix domain-containing protein n=1 Tax=Wickerhamomyces anomalus (strain ATCC 58044 / CBS 1984 / NCYC 433 / NRRL Y-366-8) TaxID=683960 RepID=A0A1E3P5Q9_WICAA|nr:uncharacterized protein WICANDRAFT_67454 [Wickerhamomyces anomalus NRRL Y-366-8]ODQ60781.1 hypothetical protein WICANDRAFT_67454 [Wickerhamomyces anomalus NRRL Y-366-8]